MRKDLIQLGPGVRVPAAVLSWSYARAGGPGGQNVNKVASKAVLRVAVDDLRLGAGAESRLRGSAGRYLTNEGELVIASDTFRDRVRNREECLARLAKLVGDAVPPPKKRRATKPTRGSVERRISAKKHRSDIKKSRRARDE